MTPRPPSATLFPYTTLFRSVRNDLPGRREVARHSVAGRATDCDGRRDRKSTRLNSSHLGISYAVFCLKKKISTYLAWPHIQAAEDSPPLPPPLQTSVDFLRD